MCVRTRPFCWQHLYALIVSVMAPRLLIWTYSNFEGSRGPYQPSFFDLGAKSDDFGVLQG